MKLRLGIKTDKLWSFDPKLLDQNASYGGFKIQNGS
jgi:hypothetical protein